jgi:hypothetical protein
MTTIGEGRNIHPIECPSWGQGGSSIGLRGAVRYLGPWKEWEWEWPQQIPSTKTRGKTLELVQKKHTDNRVLVEKWFFPNWANKSRFERMFPSK